MTVKMELMKYIKGDKNDFCEINYKRTGAGCSKVG